MTKAKKARQRRNAGSMLRSSSKGMPSNLEPTHLVKLEDMPVQLLANRRPAQAMPNVEDPLVHQGLSVDTNNLNVTQLTDGQCLSQTSHLDGGKKEVSGMGPGRSTPTTLQDRSKHKMHHSGPALAPSLSVQQEKPKPPPLVKTPVGSSARLTIYAELREVWKLDPRVPSVISRRAWAAARGVDAQLVHSWFNRTKAQAKKSGSTYGDGPYELSLESPPGFDRVETESRITQRHLGRCDVKKEDCMPSLTPDRSSPLASLAGPSTLSSDDQLLTRTSVPDAPFTPIFGHFPLGANTQDTRAQSLFPPKSMTPIPPATPMSETRQALLANVHSSLYYKYLHNNPHDNLSINVPDTPTVHAAMEITNETCLNFGRFSDKENVQALSSPFLQMPPIGKADPCFSSRIINKEPQHTYPVTGGDSGLFFQPCFDTDLSAITSLSSSSIIAEYRNSVLYPPPSNTWQDTLRSFEENMDMFDWTSPTCMTYLFSLPTDLEKDMLGRSEDCNKEFGLLFSDP